MKRKAYEHFLKWKDSNGKTALLVKGARRVGKSFLVEEFAKNEYKTYILIDFNKADSRVKDIFENNIDDLDSFFLMLQTFYNVKLYKRESVIIFDEVQLFPRARSCIKYLVEDGRYDFIETGSLVSIYENVKDILIPSEEESINLYPFDFEEFLWAMGNETLMPFIQSCYENKQQLGQALHRKAMEYFRQYLIVGGMPQAVAEFIEAKDFEKVDAVKRRILNLYRDDIQKHAKGYETKVKMIFDEIPSQLKNQNRHFKLSALKEGARYSDYKESMFWLSDAMVVNHCYASTEPNVGLSLNLERTLFKFYMADTGLLISHSFDEKGIVSEEIYKKILFDKLEVNLGMIVENVVAQMLTASGHKLYFYENNSKTDAASRMEIDFLISKSKITSRHNICPIEVKSTKNYTFSSLNKFRNKYAENLDKAYLIHPEDYKEENEIIFLPLYMAGLL